MHIRSFESIIDLFTSLRNKSVFVCGIGGGGDVLATIPTINLLKSLGVNIILGAVIWERYVVDPLPGPISLGEMRNIEIFNETIGFVKPDTYAIRNNKKIIPQLVRVAKFYDRLLIAIDISKGVKPLTRDLKKFLRENEVELIIGIDGGGDVLAKGGEEELWSPIADQVMLSTISNQDIYSIIGVFGLGTDGELPVTYLLKRISEIAKKNGYLGLIGISRKDIVEIEKLLRIVVTETNAVALRAAKGESGYIKIRNGSRSVDLSLGILTPVTVYLDAKILYTQSKMARLIKDTESIWEVWKIFNSMGIFTELDLEYGVQETIKEGSEPNPLEIRKKWSVDPTRYLKNHYKT